MKSIPDYLFLKTFPHHASRVPCLRCQPVNVLLISWRANLYTEWDTKKEKTSYLDLSGIMYFLYIFFHSLYGMRHEKGEKLPRFIGYHVFFIRFFSFFIRNETRKRRKITSIYRVSCIFLGTLIGILGALQADLSLETWIGTRGRGKVHCVELWLRRLALRRQIFPKLATFTTSRIFVHGFCS